MGWTSLCDVSEIEAGRGKYVEIGGFHLAVFLHDGKPFVIDNYCPHAGGSLAAGFVDDGCAVCPWHFWSFHLDSGQLRDAPGVAVTRYDVRTIDPGGGKAPIVQADLPMY